MANQKQTISYADAKQKEFEMKNGASQLYDKILYYGDLIVSERILMDDYYIFIKYEERGFSVVAALDTDNLRLWASVNNIDFVFLISERAYRFRPSKHNPNHKPTQ